jgi:hypothetical protein
MLILRILPFWTNVLLEEVIVGLESELRDRSDVVLESISRIFENRGRQTNIDTPEFLNRVEGDDLFQQVIPVLLSKGLALVFREVQAQTYPPTSTGWLGEPECPLVHERMLDVEVVLVMKHGDLLILSSGLRVLVATGTLWRGGNSSQVNRCRDIDGGFGGDCSHGCCEMTI